MLCWCLLYYIAVLTCIGIQYICTYVHVVFGILSLLCDQVTECEDEHPLPAEEDPPSPPHETTPSPVATGDNSTATPTSPKQRRSKRKKRRRQRPHPVGGADDEEGDGMNGRGEGGEEESADDLEFHDAHSELPGTYCTYIQYVWSVV